MTKTKTNSKKGEKHMVEKTNLDVVRKRPKKKTSEIMFESTESCKKFPFCKPGNNLECAILLELDMEVPKEMCVACIGRWLEKIKHKKHLATQKIEKNDRKEEANDTI